MTTQWLKWPCSFQEKSYGPGMIDVPYGFVESLCLVSSSSTLSLENHNLEKLKELSGNYHRCAEELMKKGHSVVFHIKDDQVSLQDECFDYQLRRIGANENFDFQISFTLSKFVHFYGSSPNVNSRALQNIISYPGRLHLFLETSDISQEWIQLFSSWTNLTTLVVEVDKTESITELHQKLVNNGCLHSVVYRSNNTPFNANLDFYFDLFCTCIKICRPFFLFFIRSCPVIVFEVCAALTR